MKKTVSIKLKKILEFSQFFFLQTFQKDCFVASKHNIFARYHFFVNRKSEDPANEPVVILDAAIRNINMMNPCFIGKDNFLVMENVLTTTQQPSYQVASSTAGDKNFKFLCLRCLLKPFN